MRRRRSLLQSSVKPLAPMPDTYGPWNEAWKNSIALCTVIRDENATDVREWLQYHRWLGVDHVFLTENNSVNPIKDAIQDFIDSNFVTYYTMDQPHAQLKVYRQCLVHHRWAYNWMAFFDADEYLAVRDRNTTLKQLLDEYKHFPGLAVHWIFLGGNGHVNRPESGGVLKHYTTCWPQPLAQIKMIANTFFVQNLAHHPHNFFFWGKTVPVNEGRHPIPYRIIGKSCAPGSRTCFLTAGHELNPAQTVHRIALYHYVTRSLEDFKIKAKRGGGNDHNGKPLTFYTALQQNMEEKPICKELSHLADKCCAAKPLNVASTA